MHSAHLDSSHKDIYFARDRGHPAFKPSFLGSQVFLDGEPITNWQVVNVKEGYIVTYSPDKMHVINRGNVKVIKDTYNGRSETYSTR